MSYAQWYFQKKNMQQCYNYVLPQFSFRVNYNYLNVCCKYCNASSFLGIIGDYGVIMNNKCSDCLQTSLMARTCTSLNNV